MSRFGETLKGYAKYKGSGHWAFVLHRLTGLAIILFLLIHVVDTAFVYFWPAGYEHAIRLYRSPLFGIGEILLVFAVIYHALNGLRIAVFDLWYPEGWEMGFAQKSVVWTLTIAIILWIPAAVAMGQKMLAHLGG